MEHPSHPVESHWRTSLRNRIIQASSLLEVLLSGLVLIGLLLSVVPLIRWMPGLLFDGNEAEIRTFLERSLDIVIGIEFIKMLAKHSPGSSLEVLLYAIARQLDVPMHMDAYMMPGGAGATALTERTAGTARLPWARWAAGIRTAGSSGSDRMRGAAEGRSTPHFFMAEVLPRACRGRPGVLE